MSLSLAILQHYAVRSRPPRITRRPALPQHSSSSWLKQPPQPHQAAATAAAASLTSQCWAVLKCLSTTVISVSVLFKYDAVEISFNAYRDNGAHIRACQQLTRNVVRHSFEILPFYIKPFHID